MALVTVSLRQRMSLAVLRVRDGVIVLQTMMWPDEVRQPDFAIDPADTAKPEEVAMAKMLVDSLAGDFNPDDYEDDYRTAVAALVEAKISGGDLVRPPTATRTSGEVVDLLAALQRSVDQAKKRQSDGDSGGAKATG
jgi:DNA end-binding protein Ku